MKRDRGKIKATREGEKKKDYEREGDERQREKLPKEASKGERVETVCEIESEDANSGALKEIRRSLCRRTRTFLVVSNPIQVGRNQSKQRLRMKC